MRVFGFLFCSVIGGIIATFLGYSFTDFPFYLIVFPWAILASMILGK